MTDWNQWSSMDFPARLNALMKERGETPSDLARRIWGEVINPKTGYSEAKSRDRITAYTKGRAHPNAENQRLIAKAYWITVEDLFAPPVAPDGWSVSSVAGMPDALLVRNSGMTSAELALLFMRAVSSKG